VRRAGARPLLVALAWVTFLQACTGAVMDLGDGRPPAAPGANGGRPTGSPMPGRPDVVVDPDPTPDPPPARCLAKAPAPRPSVVRRLTRFEYNNTVRDLLGDVSSPADALPAEELGNGFGNDAAAQSVSSLLAEQYARLA
jgi:hypothetical protein